MVAAIINNLKFGSRFSVAIKRKYKTIITNINIIFVFRLADAVYKFYLNFPCTTFENFSNLLDVVLKSFDEENLPSLLLINVKN